MPEPSILAMRSVWAFVSSTFATPFVMTLRAGFRPHPLVQVATGTSSSQSVHSILVLLSVFMSLFLSVGLVKRGRIDQDSNLAVTHPSRLCPEKTQKRKVAGTEKRVRTPSAPASEGRLGKIFNFFRAVRFSPLKNPLSAVRTDEAAVHGNAGKVWHSFSRTVSAG